MWQLVINGPGYFDTTYDLPEGTTHVGRADENDVVLSGDLVSRKHARFHVRGDALTLEDLGSRNGCKLNGKPVSGSHALKAHDVVAVGENALEVRQPSTAESASTEMIDSGAGGAVKRFGRGVDIAEAVVMARDVKESAVLKALDNILPFEPPPAPGKPARKRSRPPGDTDPDEVKTNEAALEAVASEASPVAWQSLLLLYRVAERLATATTLQAFLDETTDLVMQRVEATTGVILLRHPTGVFVPAAVRHASRLRKGEVPVSDAIIDAALTQGQAIAVADVRDDKRFAARESVVLYGVDQVLCIPIGTGAPWLGVLYLNRASAGIEKVEGLLDICTAIAQLLQTGIQKHQPRPAQDDRVKRMLERFYGPDVVERRLPELLAHGKLSWLEERQVTLLSADLTALLSAKLAVERLGDVLSEFTRLSAQLCFSFEGAVMSTGPALLAVFGAPYSKGDDAIRAVRAAMGLKAEWDRLCARRAPKERVALKIGLHTGKVLTGPVGAEARLEVPALGEPVQLAQWLSASANPGQILITGKTLAAVGARFDVTPLGERPLNGSRVRTAVFEVIDEDSDSGTLSGIRS